MASPVLKAFSQPRLLRPAPDPLGLYTRIGRNDYGPMIDLITRGDAECFGVVIEATAIGRPAEMELRKRALLADLDVVLDPRTLPAALPGGHSDAIAALPWGANRPHTPSDFRGARGQQLVAKIAECVMQNGFTQVLAPTHVIQSSADEWLSVDLEATHALRDELNQLSGSDVQILYVLSVPYAVLRDSFERRALMRSLRSSDVDAVWLRVEGLGANATADGVRNYIEAANDFAALGVPLVADGMGGLAGLALPAFGGVGGLAHGVTFGERVDNSNWRHARKKDSRFGPVRRIYVPELDMMLDPATAKTFLKSSTRAHGLFGCRDTECCPRGLTDMLENPSRHFLIQRMRQIARLSQFHVPRRAERFLEEQVRPATDAVVQADNLKVHDEVLTEKLKTQRKRLDALRVALGAIARAPEREAPAAVTPQTRAAREHRTHT